MLNKDFDILYNFISPITGRILCNPTYVLIGDSDGIATPTQTIQVINLPNLTEGKVWIGDNLNRPVEIDAPPGPEGPRGPKGKRGPRGFPGSSGLSGSAGLLGLAGLAGLAGRNANGGDNITTVGQNINIFNNMDMLGNRIENIAQSPGGDFDAISTRFLWDLIHDRVYIKWQV